MQTGQGTKVLLLGLASLMCCSVLAAVALLFGNDVLKGIDAGKIDPSEWTKAAVGRVLGIVGIASLIGYVLWLYGGGPDSLRGFQGG